jgi:Arylsulfotransferase (ASST)
MVNTFILRDEYYAKMVELAAAFIVVVVSISNGFAAGSPFPGYNFYASGKTCYLKDMNGKTIHIWTSEYNVMSHAYLLRDSSVLFPCQDNSNTGNGSFPSSIVLTGGRFQIIKWDGTIAWDYPYHSSTFIPHHDCTFYYTTNDLKELPTIFTIAATVESDGTIAEKVAEIKPTGPTTADIVWEWKASDHTGAGKPELLDIKKGYDGTGGSQEWLHANHVRYNQKLDQLILNLKFFSEFIIVDHSTTTEQASGHTGGRYGKGGDVLYRWGNPSNYGATGTNYFKGQHAASWVTDYFPGTRKKLPGAGNVLVISNETKMGYEIVLPSTNGTYNVTSGQAYGPSSPFKSISITGMTGNEGSITRLPNGNTLVCKGMSSNAAVEFDSAGTSVWTMSAAGATELFRIDSSYLGSTILDTGSITTPVYSVPSGKNYASPGIRYSKNSQCVNFSFRNDSHEPAVVSILSLSGRLIAKCEVHSDRYTLNSSTIPLGIYMIIINLSGKTHTEYILI